jgi:Domain of unknown function (DUF3387)
VERVHEDAGAAVVEPIRPGMPARHAVFMRRISSGPAPGRTPVPTQRISHIRHQARSRSKKNAENLSYTDVTVDWTIREQVQAKLRSKVKRLLARYGYPPDAEPGAIELVLEQTKTFAEEWAA